MTVDLLGKNFLKELDFTPDEWQHLLALSADLKAAKYAGDETRHLRGRNIALIFEKPSTRTRCAFEVAAADQGASVTYLDPSGSQIGHKESMKDTARVLGRMYDGIEFRGASHDSVETLGEFAGVPVWNGLTDSWHPTQSLCDVFTMTEHVTKPIEEIAVAYCGDGRNNVANSLLIGSALSGMDVRIVSPQSLSTDAEVLRDARRLAETTGARITVTDSVEDGVADVDFVYTDVWLSMGESADLWAERIELLLPFQVNETLMKATDNPDVAFMHCLPAFHNRNTIVGEQIFQTVGLDALEVTDDVFESPRSIVFDQAENRLHTIKAVMVATLGA